MPRGGRPAPTVFNNVVQPLLEMPTKELIIWLQKNELLVAQPQCPTCNTRSKIHMQQRLQGRKDNNVW